MQLRELIVFKSIQVLNYQEVGVLLGNDLKQHSLEVTPQRQVLFKNYLNNFVYFIYN